MTPTTNTRDRPNDERSGRRTIWTGLALAAGAAALAACGGSAVSSTPGNPPAAPSDTGSTDSTAGSDVVLPVTSNPIANTSTDHVLTIDGVLVENNVDLATGKDTDDHLAIAVTNTGADDLTGFEVYYTITDPSTGDSESYYTALPDTFSVAAGTSRSIHFDRTGAPDHFPDNPYSLSHTSLDGLDVTVEVSADGAAPQTTTVQKDPGGEEVAD